jgi:hypothetical protein
VTRTAAMYRLGLSWADLDAMIAEFKKTIKSETAELMRRFA